MALSPFVFMTSVESVQLTGTRASSLAELAAGIEGADVHSIYHHTYRFYRSHSFLGASDRSDLALWAGDNLKESAVGERLGALDLRDYRRIQDLRGALLGVLEPLKENPGRWERRVPPGLEFHFCRSVSLVLPTGHQARNLEEFLQALGQVDASCLHFHMIEAPLHFQGLVRLYPNDFSQWLSEQGFSEQAKSIADLDPYSGDLEQLRARITSIFRKNSIRETARRVVDRLGREPGGEAAALWLRRFRRGED